jgi:hypothetical protein
LRHSLPQLSQTKTERVLDIALSVAAGLTYAEV